MLTARYLAFIPFGLYRSVWRFAGSATCSRSASPAVVSEAVAAGYVGSTTDMRRLLTIVLHRRRAVLRDAIAASRFAERTVVQASSTFATEPRAGR